MALGGGRTPYDPAGALTGPARVLWAPITATLPDEAWDIIPPVNTAGEYAALGDWEDFGLAADAPVYNHSKETEGLEYEQPSTILFEQISKVERTFTAQIGQIDPVNMKIVENTDSAVTTVAAAANKSVQKRLRFGIYDSFISYRIAMVSFRPSGSGDVQEPDGTIRPCATVLVLPVCRLSAEDSEFTFERGTPVNAAIKFTVYPEETLDAGEEHGFWIFEQTGIIAGA